MRDGKGVGSRTNFDFDKASLDIAELINGSSEGERLMKTLCREIGVGVNLIPWMNHRL